MFELAKKKGGTPRKQFTTNKITMDNRSREHKNKVKIKINHGQCRLYRDCSLTETEDF